MTQYVGLLTNWDKLSQLPDIQVQWVFVDGTSGLCIFDSECDLIDLKEIIGLSNIIKLCSVVEWNVESEAGLCKIGNQSDVFHYKAIRYPVEQREHFEYSAVYVNWCVLHSLV